jgi:tRNA(Ile)-lysidine synthase
MLSRAVEAFALRAGLWTGGRTRVLAAVSGGSDSVAMLLLLHDLHLRGALQLEAMAHLNHLIRAEAGEDERFCAQLAERLGVAFVSDRVDVPAMARQQRQSIEIAARAARRAFLEGVRRTRGADVVATAHTQDDQAETVMLRLLRGAGTRGLASIAPVSGRIIRPVLGLTRAELQDELRGRNQEWREDPTNEDLTNPRNRVRRELLPYLERHFNPSARAALARAAALARLDEDALDRAALAAAIGVVEAKDGWRQLDRAALAALPAAIARRVVRGAISSLRLQTPSGRDHVEAVLAVARGDTGAAEIPGARVEPSGRFVVLERKSRRTPARPPFLADLPIPGEVRWEEARVVVLAEGPLPAAGGAHHPATEGVTTVMVAADELGEGLIVRSRRHGDRLQPFGLTGHKKLQDLLTDRKVARRERDLVPIVTDRRGRIVWVSGHVIGEDFRVSDRTNAVII